MRAEEEESITSVATLSSPSSTFAAPSLCLPLPSGDTCDIVSTAFQTQPFSPGATTVNSSGKISPSSTTDTRIPATLNLAGSNSFIQTTSSSPDTSVGSTSSVVQSTALTPSSPSGALQAGSNSFVQPTSSSPTTSVGSTSSVGQSTTFAPSSPSGAPQLTAASISNLSSESNSTIRTSVVKDIGTTSTSLSQPMGTTTPVSITSVSSQIATSSASVSSASSVSVSAMAAPVTDVNVVTTAVTNPTPTAAQVTDAVTTSSTSVTSTHSTSSDISTTKPASVSSTGTARATSSSAQSSKSTSSVASSSSTTKNVPFSSATPSTTTSIQVVTNSSKSTSTTTITPTTLPTPVAITTSDNGHTTISYPPLVTIISTSTEPDGSAVTFTHVAANPTGFNTGVKDVGFIHNQGAVAGVFVVIGVVVSAMVVGVFLFFRRRRRIERRRRWLAGMQQQRPPSMSGNPFEDSHGPSIIPPVGYQGANDQDMPWDGSHGRNGQFNYAGGAVAQFNQNDRTSEPDHMSATGSDVGLTGVGAGRFTGRRPAPPSGPFFDAPYYPGATYLAAPQPFSQLAHSAQSSPSIYPASLPNIADDDNYNTPYVDSSRPQLTKSLSTSSTAPPRPPRSHLRESASKAMQYQPMTPPASDTASKPPSPSSESFKGQQEIFARRTLLDLRPRNDGISAEQ